MKVNLGRFALVGAVLAAFLAAFGHVRYIQGLQVTKTVVVAAARIEPYQKLDASKLKLVQLPASAVNPKALTSLSKAVNQYTQAALVADQVLQEDHLIKSDGSPLAAHLTMTGDPNARAMALKVNVDTGVAHTLRTGDRVDVLAAVEVQANGQATSFSKVIAQSVSVLYTPFGNEKTDVIGGSKDPTVVLQVTPEMAEEIAFIQRSGTIWLLTTPYDSQSHPTAGMDMDAFRKKYAIAVSAAQAAPAATNQNTGNKGGK